MDKARIEQISKALGDETRLLIFEAISAREDMNCGEIVSSLENSFRGWVD
jgi:DNA-binding transcriptional ArsR family regulator